MSFVQRVAFGVNVKNIIPATYEPIYLHRSYWCILVECTDKVGHSIAGETELCQNVPISSFALHDIRLMKLNPSIASKLCTILLIHKIKIYIPHVRCYGLTKKIDFFCNSFKMFGFEISSD
jgi:hypothetical protein